MCYAIPGRVEKIENRVATVSYFGETKTARNELERLDVGDYIYAQGGYVIDRIPEREALDILSTWKEAFFELQELDLRISRAGGEEASGRRSDPDDRRILAILDRAVESRPLSRKELLELIGLEDPYYQGLLYKSANFLRRKHLGNSCCVHGIIEFSNHCSRSCRYCGISTFNAKLERFRMTPQEIVETACRAIDEFGFKALVLQSGEDPGFGVDALCDVIRDIKRRSPALLLVSSGEVGIDSLARLYEAGARGLLMRFETSNPTLYESYRPFCKLETRLAHIREAYGMGYLVLTGALVGMPGQTDEDRLNDIVLAKDLHAEMISFGPFIPHPDSPFADSPAAGPEQILTSLAVARLADPESAKILVTTAFETIDPEARRKGLLAGANSVMVNVTPHARKRNYSIYPNRAHTEESLPAQIEATIGLLRSLGRAPTDLGTDTAKRNAGLA